MGGQALQMGGQAKEAKSFASGQNLVRSYFINFFVTKEAKCAHDKRNSGATFRSLLRVKLAWQGQAANSYSHKQ